MVRVYHSIILILVNNDRHYYLMDNLYAYLFLQQATDLISSFSPFTCLSLSHPFCFLSPFSNFSYCSIYFAKHLSFLKHFSVRFQSIFIRHRISHPFLFILNAIPESIWITHQTSPLQTLGCIVREYLGTGDIHNFCGTTLL